MAEGGAPRAQGFARKASLSIAGIVLVALALFALLNVDRLEAWGAGLATHFRGGLPLPLTLLVVFFAGVLTSLTPCVYPVVPLAVTYLGARGATSRLRAFSLAAAYVLGMVACYTALGAAAGLTGTTFGAATQKWWVYAAVATVVLLFGLSMLGLFTFSLPPALQKLIGKSKGPGYKGAVLMGATSGLVTAPCTAPVLGTLIIPMISRQSVLLGSLLLAVFGLGMGMLFLVVGTYSGVLSSLPRSGRWMEIVKTALGVAILLVSAYFFYQAYRLRPVLTPKTMAGAVMPWRQHQIRPAPPEESRAPESDAEIRQLASFMFSRMPPSGDMKTSPVPSDRPIMLRAGWTGAGVAADPALRRADASSARVAARQDARGRRGGDGGEPERPAAPGGAVELRPAPAFEIVDLKGRRHDLQAYRGKTLHLVFFAVWCPPCVEQIRALEVADARLRGRGYRVLVVGLKEREELEALREFAAKRTLPFPVAWDQAGKAASAFGIESIPTHVIVGPDGRIVYEGRDIPDGFEKDGAGLLPP